MLLTCSLKIEDKDVGDDLAGRRPLPSSVLSLAFFCSQDSLPPSLFICFFFFLIFSVFFSLFSLYLLFLSSWFLFCSFVCSPLCLSASCVVSWNALLLLKMALELLQEYHGLVSPSVSLCSLFLLFFFLVPPSFVAFLWLFIRLENAV